MPTRHRATVSAGGNPCSPAKPDSVSFKDHFSDDPDNYQQYRPGYPDALFEWLASNTPSCQQAWDCATGNGQAAIALARHFSHVIATDGSEQQISAAMPSAIVDYRVARETCDAINDDSIDIITVAQALHWFDTENFFHEVRRVLKPGGLLAVWGYNLLSVNAQIDDLIRKLYYETVGPYWPAERRLLEQGYEAITFPWKIMSTPVFNMRASWQRQQLIGYLGTWSAVKYYEQDLGVNPLITLDEQLQRLWPDAAIYDIHWPLALYVSQKPAMV